MKTRRRRFEFLILITSLALIATPVRPESPPDGDTENALDALVTVDWLSRHLADPDLVVLDCTVLVLPGENGAMSQVSGRSDYEDGHLPTAGFADLMGDLSDVDNPLEFSLPTAEAFCAAMGALGVGDDTRVVLYDATFSVWATRVWWMLRWVGFDRAAVLDGGLRAWTAADQPLSREPASHRPQQLTPALRPTLIADRDEVFAAIDDPQVLLIDSMPAFHYQGEMALYDRPGHIPGAVNIPTTALLEKSGRYRTRDELAAIFGGDRETRAIAYCGSGIAASAAAFTMHRLGFTDVAVYIASLQEWAADPVNPLVVGQPVSD